MKILRPSADVIELGPHLGGFLQPAEEWDWRPIGVDVGEYITAFVRAKGLKVVRGTLEDRRSKAEHSTESSFGTALSSCPIRPSYYERARRVEAARRAGGTCPNRRLLRVTPRQDGLEEKLSRTTTCSWVSLSVWVFDGKSGPDNGPDGVPACARVQLRVDYDAVCRHAIGRGARAGAYQPGRSRVEHANDEAACHIDRTVD